MYIFSGKRYFFLEQVNCHQKNPEAFMRSNKIMASPLGDAKLLKLLVHALEVLIVLQDPAIQHSAGSPARDSQLQAWQLTLSLPGSDFQLEAWPFPPPASHAISQALPRALPPS